MSLTALCAVVAVLRVVPDRSQFFQYESVSLSCEHQGNSSEWSVKRNTSRYINQDCSMFGNTINESHCSSEDLYTMDSGVYWCESAAGECSDAVNILVTGGPVILESPAVPVMEGDAVTLSCRTKSTFSSNNISADFYKDGLFISSSSTGEMTIHSVSKSDEGLYKCNVSGGGESPDGWLAVRAGRPESMNSPLLCFLLPVVGVCLLLVCVILFCLWRNHKGKEDPDVAYTDVTITEDVQPNRMRDVTRAATFYTKVKAES
ncbi:Fc receptor-like protein 5 [Centropristis striata]|uniref:Fc receptor-like protein 5 n=1 Tax=Centropristis striata TaxID=184440 RepID=UPI0027E119E9|nr:Fc receptor-like protein 5 [Centropristis striata]